MSQVNKNKIVITAACYIALIFIAGTVLSTTKSVVLTMPLLVLGLPLIVAYALNDAYRQQFLKFTYAIMTIQVTFWGLGVFVNQFESLRVISLILFGITLMSVLLDLLIGLPLSILVGVSLMPFVSNWSEAEGKEYYLNQGPDPLNSIIWITGPVMMSLIIVAWKSLPKNKK